MRDPLSSRIVLPTNARPAIISALAALALYAVTLRGTFVFDDWSILVDDPRITHVSQWPEFFTRDYFNGGPDNLYRPLTSLSYAVEARIFGNSPADAWAYHLLNWLLHAAVAACVAELARRMTGSRALALFAGLLFAAHPIHVEAVANIVGRAELLCAMGIGLALILFLTAPSYARTWGIWGCFLFAVLSKEQGMLVPLLLVLAIPLRRRIGVTGAGASSSSGGEELGTLNYAHPDVPRPRAMSEPSWLLLLLMIWTLAAYLLFREHILPFEWDRSRLNPAINPLLESHGIDRFLMPIALFGRYVALLVFPLHLSPDYGLGVIGPHASWGDGYLWIGIVSIAAWLIACIFAFVRRAQPVLFCLLAFAALYGMVANLVALIGTDFNERLMYIPSIFVCILAAAALRRLPRRMSCIACGIVLALLSFRTVSYAVQWNHPARLYAGAIRHQPRDVQLYLLLGAQLHRQGDEAGASKAVAAARALYPDYYRAWLVSAQIALEEGRYDDACTFAAKAFDLKPSLATQGLLQRARDLRRSAAAHPATTQAR